MNFLRKRTKYSNGIKIWCYSRKNAEINKMGWHHTTEDVDYYLRTLHRAPFESPELRGYRSTIIKTEYASYTLFGIELTDEIKKALKPE